MAEETAHESMDVCGIEGDANAPLTIGVFNRFIAQLRYYHKRPIEHKLSSMEKTLKESVEKIDGHIQYHTALENQIAGARRAFYFMAAMITLVAPIVYKFLEIVWPLIRK